MSRITKKPMVAFVEACNETIAAVVGAVGHTYFRSLGAYKRGVFQQVVRFWHGPFALLQIKQRSCCFLIEINYRGC